MAQINYRANLDSPAFPFIADNAGQSVIIKGYDNNYIPATSPRITQDLDKDVGYPEMYYCHNVMPASQGISSVGYKLITYQLASNEALFVGTFLVRNAASNSRAYFGYTSDGRNYILLPGAQYWKRITDVAGSAGKQVTRAYINGETYIYFAGVGCYRYDFSSGTLIAVTLTGLTPTAVQGIVSSQGYLIAWDNTTTVAWSSTIDPTDFTPSLTTGAGSGSVIDAKGTIILCVHYLTGFMVFTTNNAIGATYSQNARFPFVFKEIGAAGGLVAPELFARSGQNSQLYAYTTAGLQQLTMQEATIVNNEITDFISGAYFQDFDEVSLQFVNTVLSSPMKKRINFIASRYLVISYGIVTYTHAIVFDTALRRYGKLKVPHVDIFELSLLDSTSSDIPKNDIGILQADGTIKTVDFSYGSSTSNGVVILGKYQYTRDRLLQLEAASLYNIKSGANFSIKALSTLDGKNPSYVKDGFLSDSNNNVRNYAFHTTGINHSLLCMGSFALTTLVLSFNVHGRR